MTSDSFYSTQGRVVDHFDDRNAELLAAMTDKFPSLACAEMETFHLFDLARSAKEPTIASAAAIALANRNDTRVLTHEEFHLLERTGGEAILRALTAVPIDADPGPEDAVWKHL